MIRTAFFAMLTLFAGVIAPVKDCAGKVIHYVLTDNLPDPTPDEPHPTQMMNCAFFVQVADASGRFEYAVVSGLGKINGWGWWQACPVTAKYLGYVIPAVKASGQTNDPSGNPRLLVYLDTAPVFGIGHGHYSDPLQGSNTAIFAKAYIFGRAA